MHLKTIPIMLALVASLFALPAFAQRTFRASPIDEQQNARLDQHDNELSKLKVAVANIEEKLGSKPTIDKKPIVPPALAQAVYPSQQVQSPAGPQRYTRTELESLVRARYPNGFRVRYADVNPRSAVWSHLKAGVHGFSSAQVDGMEQWVALALHDMEHGKEIGPFKPRSVATTAAPAAPIRQQYPQPMQVSYAPPIQYAPISRPIAHYPQPFQYAGGFGSGCANGSCARPSYGAVYRQGMVFRVR